MAGLGKSLEAVARRIRPYLRSADRRAFSALVARGLSERRDGEPIVCCDFADPAIDAVGGRYYFSLVRDLIDAGFFPVFVARRATLSSFGTSRMKALLLRERIGVVASLDALQESYFLMTDSDVAPQQFAVKVVKVSYEQRLCDGENEIAFPVFVHPQITTSVELPFVYAVEEARAARIFFGGNTEVGKYDKDVIRKVYEMLTRREMLDVVGAAAPACRPADSAQWLGSKDFHPFVLCETQHCKIPRQRWLDALAKTDFFLACPGVGMPLCHNLIEAMSAGAIPILQYGDYLPQPLEHGVNCLVFRDSESLREITAAVLAMSPEQILGLRENVRAYHAEFLAPGRFAQRLFSSPDRTLLLNAYRVPRI
jgi:hypothetical protein